jgi:cell division protease FtsH
MAYGMVTLYGMNKEVGPVSFHDPQGEYQFRKPYSEETALLIDLQVRKIIDEAYQRTLHLIRTKRDILEAIAKELLAKEVIFQQDLLRLAGPRPFTAPGPHAAVPELPTESEGATDQPT